VEPLAAANGIVEQVEIKPDTQVAVVGDGKLGLLCALTMVRRTKNIVLFGKHAEKMALASQKGRDIETQFSSTSHDFSASFDVVIEASGSESGFSTALDLVRPRGQVVLKSTFHGKTGLDASRIVVNEITVLGSRCGRFGPALELLSKGEIELEDLVSEEFSLSDGLEAMQRATENGVLKVLLAT
jgi:threonine dehydrogenase-like Zn-dependent dehydrogenase